MKLLLFPLWLSTQKILEILRCDKRFFDRNRCIKPFIFDESGDII